MMPRQVMLIHVDLHVTLGPGQQGIDFQQAVILQFQDFGVRTARRLVPPDAADPGLQSAQGLLHRLYLVNVTAQVWIFSRQGARVLACEHIPA